MPDSKREIISELRKDILLWEGFKPQTTETKKIAGMTAIEAAFPNSIFPAGAIHEFLSAGPEQAAVSGGFITGILSALMKQGSVCLWISSQRTVFPPALKFFGIDPARVIFVTLRREKDVLWATEEALKCKGIAAVISEVCELTFKESRRLQLAVETSRVTGFILRKDQKINSTACVARWQIKAVPSETNGLPGVGFPRWQIELLKVRNGHPGKWQMEWTAGNFTTINEDENTLQLHGHIRKVG